MPAKYRTPLVLCYLAEKTHEQAARELGWPKSSVTARLAKARQLLHHRLRRRGFTVPAGLLAALLTEATANAALPSLLALATVRLAVQALAGETLTATSSAALGGSFVKGTMALKLGATLALLATLGFAAVGFRMAVSRFPYQKQEGAPKAQTAGERREAKSQPHKPRVDLSGDPLPDGAVARIGSGRMRHFGLYGDACPLAFTPDGKSIVSGGRGGLRIWDAATGKLRLRLNFDAGAECCLAFALQADGIRAASANETKEITDRYIAWDPASGREIRRMAKPPASPRDLALSPDESLLAGADPKGTIRLWAAATGRFERALKGHQDKIYSIVFAPDSRRLASAGYDKTIRVWDVANGRQLHQFNVKGIEIPTFSPDGRWLASPSHPPGPTRDVQIILWDLVSGREKSRFGPIRNKIVYRLAFAPNSRLLAAVVGGNGRDDPSEIAVWDVADGTRLHILDGHKTGAWSVAFSPDGRMLAIGGSDGALMLWELASDHKRHQFIGHEDVIGSLAFSPDGRYLAADSSDAPALVWDVFGVVAAPQRRLSNDELQRCWAVLAGNDAAAAFQSIRRLAAAPEQTLPFLRQHLKPVPLSDNKPMRRLLEMLDSDDFATRQKATEELEKQADAGLLRQIVTTEKPSLEVRRRLQQIVEGMKSNPEALRVVRAVEVLEWIGTTEAVRLLVELANGAAEARLTCEAVAAKRRLSH